MKLFSIILGLISVTPVLAVDFDLSGKAFAPKNPVLAPFRAGTPIAAKLDTAAPQEGAILRKKQPDGKYSLFEGRIQKNARDSLSFFHTPDFASWVLIRNAKFFTQSPNSASNELEEVYWDGGLLAIPGEVDTLYAQTSEGVAVLPAVSGQPVTLRIETSPRAAVLTTNGQIRGTTPLEFRSLGGRWVWVRLSKLGYFTWEDIIEADPEQPTDLSIALKERPSFQDGTPADTSGMIAHGSKDINEVATLISKITSKKINRESQDAALWLSDYLDSLRTRQFVEYIPTQNLSVQDWDSTQGGLPVRLWYGANDFDFGFIGVIPCSREESYSLASLMKAKQKSATLKESKRARRASWPSAHATSTLDGFVRLKYKNWATDTRTNSRNVHRYFAMDALDLVLPEQTISITGTFLPAAYITQSAEWKAFIASTEANEE